MKNYIYKILIRIERDTLMLGTCSDVKTFYILNCQVPLPSFRCRWLESVGQIEKHSINVCTSTIIIIFRQN